ncbi:MAG TPA: VWA domain-containing protein, partial [Vicinamibacterales bacterium]|nr:VWA domain-containing protein [Vicinamibacterales bacterium]
MAILLAVCGFGAAVAAQQTSAQPRARFSSSVDIVQVDVNVIDRNGHPVRDLRADDFALTVDGRARQIVSAQFISIAAPDAARAAAPDVITSDYVTNVGAAAGRLIAIIVDRGSIAPVRAKDVFASAARFVDRLQPADRIALFSVPTGTAVDFTTDHDAVVSALQRMDGQADPGPNTKNVSVGEALQFEHGNGVTIEEVTSRECGASSSVGPGTTGLSELMVCRKAVTEEAGIVAAYAHERAHDTLSGLDAVLGRLASSDTPKTIVLVSEALVIDGDRYATANLARAVAAAHATIYALKPERSESDASQARAPQNFARDRAAREEGLSALARIGGGELFRVVSDPDFAFDRLALELSGYYLLGFEPDAGDRDGKQHAIRVNVTRSGVAVRSRLEFSVGPAGRRNDQAIVADLLRSPAIASDLPFRLTTYAFQDPASPKIRLLVAMEVERAADPDGHMAMGIALVKPGGELGATFFQPAIDAPKGPASKPQRSFATLLVDPGEYVLKAAVVDNEGRRGSLERPVRAFLTRMSRFRATELLIGDDEGGQAAAGNVIPTVSGDISGGQLHVYLELFSDTPAGFDGAA